MFFDHLWTSKYMPRTVISDEQNGGLQIFPSNLPWKHNIQHLLWSWLQVNCNSVSQVQQGSLLNWLTRKQEYVCPHLLLLFRCIFPFVHNVSYCLPVEGAYFFVFVGVMKLDSAEITNWCSGRLLALQTKLLSLSTTLLVLSMWPCKLKLDEEKLKHARLAQQNGFGPAFLHSFLRLVKGTAKPNTCYWLAR
jgi:hypothetical protein